MIDNNSLSETGLIEETLRELEYFTVLEHVSKHAISEQGKELIFALKPTGDTGWLRRELDLTEEMIHVLTEDDTPPFEGINDIRTLLQKSLVDNAVLNPTDFLYVRDSIRVSRLIKNYFNIRRQKYELLSVDASELHDNLLFEKHITEAIDETGEVRDNATKELFTIRREIREKSNQLRSRIQRILKQVAAEDMVMEEFATIREERFVIPVKSEHKRHIPGIIHGVSQTGATVFLEPTEIFEMNNEISLLKNEEKREIYKILSNLTTELGEDARKFLRSLAILAHIDSLMAKAKYALAFGGVKPEILERTEIFMKNVRHPLLVHAKKAQNVIPLSIEFSETQRGHLISGPNAGGKTVALKSIGINIALALSGIYPLGECKTDYRDIYSAIGDHQSIENDLSTFSSEILKLKDIIDNCTSKSLVLIDEIGSGTDPQEGSALAAGILDTFIELKLFFVATTHQSSLKSYALSRKEIQNASLEFDEEHLKPTYKFMEGIPGNSYAFVLAESLGLSKLVIDRAKRYVGTRQSELEESIAQLQKYRSEAEKLKLAAAEEKLKAEKLRLDYEEKLLDLKQRKAKYVDQARTEATEIIQNANALIERTIKEVREEKRPISEIKREYTEEKKKIENKIEKEDQHFQEIGHLKEKYNPALGDFVSVEGGFDVGTVIQIDDGMEKALVEINGVKFRLPYNKLAPTAEKKTKTEGYSGYINFGAETRIDLRGMRAEEAIRLVDDFICQALTGSVNILTIIHGKGTGALRVAIHEFLKMHPSVVSFRLGDLVEGGAGVTVVEL